MTAFIKHTHTHTHKEHNIEKERGSENRVREIGEERRESTARRGESKRREGTNRDESKREERVNIRN